MVDFNRHTPGPWVRWIDYDDDNCIVAAGVDTGDRAVNIAVCCENMETDDPDNERQLVADLTLIAAAPELLAACERVMTLKTGADVGEVFRVVEAALSKAKGTVQA